VTLAGFAHDNFLYRDTEGWLVLQTVDLSVAVPWFEYKRRWYRFRQRE
jgi:hypothetical protein